MPLKIIKPNTIAFTVMLAAIAALTALLTDMNLPAVPQIEQTFHTAPGQGSLTISIFLFGFALAPVVGGPLSDCFGRKRVLVPALSAISAAALGCALAGSFHQLLFFRMVKGIACGFCMLMPLAIIRDCLEGSAVRRQHAKIMLIVGLGPLLAPIMGSWLLALANWRAIYAAHAAMGLFDVILISAFYTESLPPEKRIPLNPGKILSSYRTLFSTRKYLGHALLVAFGFGCIFSYITGSPGLMIGMFHLSEQSYSLVFALTAMGMISGSYLAGWFSRREIMPKPIIAFFLSLSALAVSGAFILSLSGAVTLPAIIPMVFVVMMSFALVAPNALSEALDPVTHIAGTASGTISSMQMLVGSLASALVSLLATVMNPALAMTSSMIFSAMLAGGIYLALGLWKS